jgi:S-(hydroxymethyl)glutathione dehydrogenase/alcohol dehydrogenase
MPFDRAALLGCGVMTGVGAATRIAALRWGDVAMVIGCGAVGLSAVQGCVLAGAGAIIAVDPNPARRLLAQHSAPPTPLNRTRRPMSRASCRRIVAPTW